MGLTSKLQDTSHRPTPREKKQQDGELEIEVVDRFEAHLIATGMERRFSGLEALHRRLVDRIRQLEQNGERPPRGSRQYRAGFSTHPDFLDASDEATKTLCYLIRDSVVDYLAHCSEAGAPFDIERINIVGWGNLLRAHDWVCPHAHDPGGLAGVYYLEVPELEYPEGCLELIRPAGHRSGLGRLRPIADTRGPFETVRLMPEAGLLHLFPGDLVHLVYPFEGAGERLAIGLTITFPG